MDTQPIIKTPLLLIDGMHLLNRCFFVPSFQEFRSPKGLAIGAVYGFMQSLIRLASEYPGLAIVVVWDGGLSERRCRLHPGYKVRDRSDAGSDRVGYVPVYSLPPFVSNACWSMGIHTVEIKGVEGDDVVAALSRAAEETMIYSGDKDFLQLVRPGHSVLKPINQEDVLIHVDNFQAATGINLEPHEVRLYFAMIGDSSDKIAGVKGVGPKTAVPIIQCLKEGQWGPEYDPAEVMDPHAPLEKLEPLREICWETTRMKRKGTAKWKLLAEGWDDFTRALQLFDLWRDDLLTREEMLQALGALEVEVKFDREWFDKLMDEWGFESFDRDEIQEVMESRLVGINIQ